ncbi:MAG: flagellar biosynthesis anti-sigma factor FlgM [Calditrichaeota bacterium]|nr:flagellar biosynthesis anti-sigma factor FlgM [Calditrichota bacterium]
MKIEPIDSSSGLSPIQSPAAQSPKRVKTGRTFPAPQMPADRAEVAAASQTDARVLQGAKLLLEATPDIRQDKVELARQRLQAGFYNQPEVLAQTAEKMSADPEARPATPLSLEHIAGIKKRIAEGFYDRPEIKDQIAQSLLDDIE